jgi:hypothetical protein
MTPDNKEGNTMPRRWIQVAIRLLFLGLAGIAPAAAITYGVVDGDAHPAVGQIMYRQELSHPEIGPYIHNWGFCSGTLIAPDIFLTAAHCVYGEEPNLPILWVSFDTRHTPFELPSSPGADPTPNDPRVRIASIFTHPDYLPGNLGQNEGNTDLAVVILDLGTATGPLPAPIGLAPAGILDRLKDGHRLNGKKFTAVGYGLQERLVGHGQPFYYWDLHRRAAEEEFLALGPAYLVVSMNPALDDGGGCYGDSGGPNFIRLEDGREAIAGLTIAGDSVCRATNVLVRVDTEGAREFLATVPGLALP